MSFNNDRYNMYVQCIVRTYVLRLFRFILVLVELSPTGFIFELATTNFVINLLIFMLSGHVVG